MLFLKIVLVGFILLEISNAYVLFFTPESSKVHGMGMFLLYGWTQTGLPWIVYTACLIYAIFYLASTIIDQCIGLKATQCCSGLLALLHDYIN